MKIIIQVEGKEDQVIDIPTSSRAFGGNQYEPWHGQDDNRLRSQWSHFVQDFCDQAARDYGRTSGAIRSRLEKLSMLPKRHTHGQ